GTTDTVNVPVKQADTAVFTAIVTDETKPAVITSSDAVDTPITNQADKDAILAKVTVPAVNGQKATITSKEVTSPVKEVEGKKVVEVTVTYADGTIDTVNVPVDQKDSEANTPTVKDPAKPALISVPATENTPVTTEEDKKAITDKVNVEGLPNTPTSVVVPEGAKVTIVEDKPVVPVKVTYPDGTTDTVNVPVKQKDAAKYTPTATATPIDSLTAPGTVITPAEREAVKNAVALPEGVNGTVTVPEDASVQIGTGDNAGKPVVVATVTYPDSTSETVEVPVKQKDTAKFTAIVTDENTPAVIISSDAVDTPITSQADKDAITAKVTVPEVNGQKATITSKEVTSPVKEVEGKKVVEVTVTYADGTVDKVNVPVDQKDSEANNP
ncbi:TPA: Rib/alpha-like domain-containing protein, partial [Streptococcus suis]